MDAATAELIRQAEDEAHGLESDMRPGGSCPAHPKLASATAKSLRLTVIDTRMNCEMMSIVRAIQQRLEQPMTTKRTPNGNIGKVLGYIDTPLFKGAGILGIGFLVLLVWLSLRGQADRFLEMYRAQKEIQVEQRAIASEVGEIKTRIR